MEHKNDINDLYMRELLGGNDYAKNRKEKLIGHRWLQL